MRESTRLLLNSLVNVATGLVNMAVQLVVVPVITHAIGKAAYGVYVIVAGLTYYTPFLHMGMASAVTRYGAAHLARREYDELNATVNTSVAYYRAIAVVFLIFAGVVAWYLTDLFQIDPALWKVSRWCVLIVGVVEAMNLWMGPVGGLLWSLERYDLFNLPLTAFRFVRLGLLLVLLPWFDQATGLVCVTAVMVLTNFLPTLVQRLLAVRYTPHLKMDLRLARKRLLVPLIGFGLATLTWHWSQAMLDYVAFLLIGRYLTTVQVGEYQIPCFVLLAVHMLVDASTVVMEPAASRLHATDRREALREILLRGGTYAAGVSVGGCAGLAILAPMVLSLWVGDAFLHVSGVLTLLAIGRSVYYIQTGTYHTLTGMGKQRVPGLMSLVCVGVIAILQAGVLGWTDWGLLGVAGVTTAGLTIGWGLAIPIYACVQVGIPVGTYYRTVLFRPVVSCLPAALGWGAIRYLGVGYGWLQLAFALLSGGALLCVGWWFILFDDRDRRMIRDKLNALRDRIGVHPPGPPP